MKAKKKYIPKSEGTILGMIPIAVKTPERMKPIGKIINAILTPTINKKSANVFKVITLFLSYIFYHLHII